jgi:hypothetical protein
MAIKPRQKPTPAAPEASSQQLQGNAAVAPIPSSQPIFGEPAPSPDPKAFVVKHLSDNPLYNALNKKLLQALPPPREGANLVLKLADVLGEKSVQKIHSAGRIVFHSVGDTGPIAGPENQSLVADKMVEDFKEDDPADAPSLFFHLGDVVYSFGEGKYYYDQFYEPYRNYPAPIFAIAGNHDGMVYGGDQSPTLEAFLNNFCSAAFQKRPEAGSLHRTSMIQPGVYFTLDAPFVRIIGLYSNVLEDPGVISSQGDKNSPVGDQQIAFLKDQLNAAKQYQGALLIAVHHPPFTGGSHHGGSPKMLAEIDQVCKDTGVWPHAVLSGHAHNYQRFTRTVNNHDIPFIVAGGGGHAITSLRSKKSGGPLRVPMQLAADLIFENYDDSEFGYLRIVANNDTLRMEFHAVGPSADKAGVDAVTVDLKSHTMISN